MNKYTGVKLQVNISCSGCELVKEIYKLVANNNEIKSIKRRKLYILRPQVLILEIQSDIITGFVMWMTSVV